ncbi:MAG: DUF4115 domain-containing protein, partial [Gammaproteobacteria bacterium]
ASTDAESGEVGVEAAQSLPLTESESGAASSPAESTPVELPSDNATVPVETSESASATAPGEAVLELRFTADCWTRVADAEGRVLYSALAKAGTSRTVSGKAPLDVHLGYARGAQLSYNGEAVSLASHMRGETARLKLGQ